MRLADRYPRVRRVVSLLLFASLLGLTAIGLSQCKAVNDNLTGVSASLARGGPGNCISRCAKAFGDSMRAEQELHHDNVDACGGDPVCLAIEKARNDAAKERIRIGRKDCFDDCHHQGGGKGGR